MPQVQVLISLTAEVRVTPGVQINHQGLAQIFDALVHRTLPPSMAIAHGRTLGPDGKPIPDLWIRLLQSRVVSHPSLEVAGPEGSRELRIPEGAEAPAEAPEGTRMQIEGSMRLPEPTGPGVSIPTA